MSHHAETSAQNRLKKAGIFNTVTSSIQLLVGIFSGSVAIRADGMHNLADGFADLLSWVGEKFSAKSPNKKMTYGYHAVAFITATINALLLLILAFVVGNLGYKRFMDPSPVSGLILIVVGISSMFINFGSYLYIHKGSKTNVNVKSAAAHALLDGLGSFLAVVAGIIISVTKWYRADGLFSLFIACLMVIGAYMLLSETIQNLLGGVPKGIDVDKIRVHIMTETDIADLHDLHVRALGPELFEASIHVVTKNPHETINELDNLRDQITRCLSNHFKVGHITIQVEARSCSQLSV